MRQFIKRVDNKVRLYFNCPEKINQIVRMCKCTNYKDITVITHTSGELGLPAGHRIKCGKGWMGKGAEICGVYYLYGGLKGIRILITIPKSVDVIDCWLEGPEDRIHLGPPTDIVDIINNWPHMCMSREEWSEEREEPRIMDMENEAIIEEARIGEMEMLEEMQTEAELEEVLQGQVD